MTRRHSYQRTSLRVAGLLLAVSPFTLGCGKDAPSPPPGRVALPDPTGQPTTPPVVTGPNGQPATPSGSSDPGTPPAANHPAAATTRTASFAAELASIYAAWASDAARLQTEFTNTRNSAISSTNPLATLVQKFFAERAPTAPLLSRDGTLTDEAQALIALIRTTPEHGLDPDPYALDRLDQALSRYNEARAARDAQRPAETPAWKLLLAERPAPGTPSDPAALGRAVAAAGLSDADLPALSAARAQLNAQIAADERLTAPLAELDALLVADLHRWVYDMRFARRAHPFIADRSDAEGVKRVSPQLAAMLQVDLTAPGTLPALVAAATPQFPDYEPTRQAYLRYLELSKQFPEHKVLGAEVDKLGPGKSGPAVRALGERLAQEGYLTTPPGDRWSADLEQAINAYQETHQFKVTGRIEKVMRASLNRSFAERAQLLALSLQRYRESDLHQGTARFGEVPVRAVINIAAMEARFYLGTELARTHRVVVGNNATETDAASGKRGKLNQTRLFSAEMASVVLNPVWNVPKRIKEQELDLLLEDEPDYYEKNNFKILQNADGSERVVQQAGPGNALGRVKFLFPNQFAIYMHDTPNKRLFERPVRAFSHGCMRTQDPLDLARWLLVQQSQRLTDEQFDAIMESREEKHFALNPKIPLSTDYVTTTIDAEGRVVFLADIYGFDKDYFAGETPYKADKDLPMTHVF